MLEFCHALRWVSTRVVEFAPARLTAQGIKFHLETKGDRRESADGTRIVQLKK